MSKEIGSARKFLCAWIEGGEVQSLETNLDDIHEKGENESDFEYNYAIQDSIDKVLDLKVDESMNFQFNRDDKDSKGVITCSYWYGKYMKSFLIRKVHTYFIFRYILSGL